MLLYVDQEKSIDSLVQMPACHRSFKVIDALSAPATILLMCQQLSKKKEIKIFLC